MKNGKDNGQLELPALAVKPVMVVPAIVVPSERPGEWIVRPGKPVVAEEEIDTAEAAKELGCSQRHVQTMCDWGVFKEGTDWRRPGRMKILLKRASVIAWKERGRRDEEPDQRPGR